MFDGLIAAIRGPLAERAFLLDWEEALEMDVAGGADAEECDACETYCGGRRAGCLADRAADDAYDSAVGQ